MFIVQYIFRFEYLSLKNQHEKKASVEDLGSNLRIYQIFNWLFLRRPWQITESTFAKTVVIEHVLRIEWRLRSSLMKDRFEREKNKNSYKNKL